MATRIINREFVLGFVSVFLLVIILFGVGVMFAG